MKYKVLKDIYPIIGGDTNTARSDFVLKSDSIIDVVPNVSFVCGNRRYLLLEGFDNIWVLEKVDGLEIFFLIALTEDN